MDKPIVIVGASLGGLRTAEALRRFGYDGPITIIGDEPYAPYNRPPLSKEALTGEVDHRTVAFAQRSATSDVDWVLDTRIVRADLEARTVTDVRGRIFSYVGLVAATGVRARRLPLAHAHTGAGGYPLRTLDDAARLRRALQPGARVVVAGAGFIGCEVAAAARTLGCDVTVIGSASYPMQRPLGAVLARELMRRHQERGVRFIMGSKVVEVLGDPRTNSVLLDDGTQLRADIVVEAIGSIYNTEWLHGNDVDVASGILTDGAMRAIKADGRPWPDVFAVGDVARFPNALYDLEPTAVGHWNIPSETAKRAGRVLALQVRGEPGVQDVLSEPFAPVPSFWSDQYDVHLLAYGLLDRADNIELIDGSLGGECVFGYFRREKMIGVCGIGLRSKVLSYRAALTAGARLTAPRS